MHPPGCCNNTPALKPKLFMRFYTGSTGAGKGSPPLSREKKSTATPMMSIISISVLPGQTCPGFFYPKKEQRDPPLRHPLSSGRGGRGVRLKEAPTQGYFNRRFNWITTGRPTKVSRHNSTPKTNRPPCSNRMGGNKQDSLTEGRAAF